MSPLAVAVAREIGPEDVPAKEGYRWYCTTEGCALGPVRGWKSPIVGPDTANALAEEHVAQTRHRAIVERWTWEPEPAPAEASA